jgi:hypothetical protein
MLLITSHHITSHTGIHQEQLLATVKRERERERERREKACIGCTWFELETTLERNVTQ